MASASGAVGAPNSALPPQSSQVQSQSPDTDPKNLGATSGTAAPGTTAAGAAGTTTPAAPAEKNWHGKLVDWVEAKAPGYAKLVEIKTDDATWKKVAKYVGTFVLLPFFLIYAPFRWGAIKLGCCITPATATGTGTGATGTATPTPGAHGTGGSVAASGSVVPPAPSGAPIDPTAPSAGAPSVVASAAVAATAATGALAAAAAVPQQAVVNMNNANEARQAALAYRASWTGEVAGLDPNTLISIGALSTLGLMVRGTEAAEQQKAAAAAEAAARVVQADNNELLENEDGDVREVGDGDGEVNQVGDEEDDDAGDSGQVHHHHDHTQQHQVAASAAARANSSAARSVPLLTRQPSATQPVPSLTENPNE